MEQVNFISGAIGEACKPILDIIADLEDCEKVEAINVVKRIMHNVSPMRNEPVDCVLWERGDKVTANDYNPNNVAPPEMKLLEVSIMEDGYTQPIVAFETQDGYEVVDGFHRNRVGKESLEVNSRILGFLPVVKINTDREDKGDRIAATIRHNRARGKHKVDAMSDIVVDLKKRNWSDKKIAKNLGMDADEILRLCQVSGLAEMFADRDFSAAWDTDESVIDMDDRLDTQEENANPQA